MNTLTLNVNNGSDYQLLLQLAKRLGINLPETKEDEVTAGKPELEMSKVLSALAARGGIKSIPDPVQWQRITRKDRKLPHRK